MITVNRSILGIVILLFLLTSCKKYLDKKSDTSLVVPKSLADLQGMLDDNILMNQNTPAMSEAAADDYFVLESTYNSYEEELRNMYTWRMTDPGTAVDWGNCYVPVYNANYCLEKINNVQQNAINATQWNYVKGAALYYRSYFFIQLCWNFSKAYDKSSSSTDPGIVLRLGSDYSKPSVRASNEDTYHKVLTDLKEAALLLPDRPPLFSSQASKTASYAMLARVYLSMREYDSAGHYASRALQINSELLDYNDASVSGGSTIPFKPLNKEIIFYSMQNTGYRAKSPSNALVDSSVYASFDINDKRKTVFFRANGVYQRFKGSYASHATNLFSGLTVGELYLTRSECYARAGKIPEAMADLNKLLEKRWVKDKFVPVSAGDQLIALKIILQERRKELLFRGTRWTDIKRLNKEGAEIIPTRLIGTQKYTIQPNSNKYAMLLPRDIIEITGIPQNEQ